MLVFPKDTRGAEGKEENMHIYFFEMDKASLISLQIFFKK